MLKSNYELLYIFAITILLIGCGGSSSDGSGSASTSQPPATSTPLPDTSEPDVSANWNLVWQDEFEGSIVDLDKWSMEVNCLGGGNNEKQCYTARSDNAYVDNGTLKIVAKRETYTGPASNENTVDTRTQPYTSARLRTVNKGDWTYGRFEIRAKLPFGQGSWPAIWMLPTDWVYGGWPTSGEIDIMEAVNLSALSDDPNASNGAEETRVHGTLHYGRAFPDNVYSGTSYTLPNNLNPADEFHVYAIEWEAGEIRWYVDGYHYATQKESGWYTQYQQNGIYTEGQNDAPFDQRFHLLINFAVGGNWPENVNQRGIDESVFPQTFEVDYVRVYECTVQPSTGAGCATLGDNDELVPGSSAPALPTVNSDFVTLPEFFLYQDELTQGLEYGSYNPDNHFFYGDISVAGRGSVLDINKTGTNGNLYFGYAPTTNMSEWLEDGYLEFDVLVLSNSDSELLVKLDSGWPNTSDYSVSLPDLGQWGKISVRIKDIIEGGNRFSAGDSANITRLTNVLVIEPSSVMQVQLDNIRFVIK